MREGREQQEAVGGVVSDDELRHRHGGELRQPGVDDALREGRRPRRVDDQILVGIRGSTGSAEPLAAALVRGADLERAHAGEERLDVVIRKHGVVVDDEAELGLTENVLELPGAVAVVDRHRGDAGLMGCDVRLDPLDSVRAVDPDALSGRDDGLQVARERLGAAIQRRERHTRRFRLDRKPIGGAARAAATEARHRRRLIRPHCLGAHRADSTL